MLKSYLCLVNQSLASSKHILRFLGVIFLLWSSAIFAQEKELIRYCQENRFNPVGFSESLSKNRPSTTSLRVLTAYEKSLNGNYLGFTQDVLALKINLNGDSIWFKTYGIANKDIGEDVLEISPNNYVIL